MYGYYHYLNDNAQTPLNRFTVYMLYAQMAICATNTVKIEPMELMP